MSATQATAMTGDERFAHAFVHQAMVGLDGSKMSKSLGNLVLVSRLRTSGVDPMTIRVLLLAQRYGVEWDYTEDLLGAATSGCSGGGRHSPPRAVPPVGVNPRAGPGAASGQPRHQVLN